MFVMNVKRWLKILSEKSKEKTVCMWALDVGQVNFRTSSSRWRRNRNLSRVSSVRIIKLFGKMFEAIFGVCNVSLRAFLIWF